MKYLFLILIILSFFSCRKENMFDCFKSTGEIIEKEIDLENFNCITINDNFQVYLKQDTINKLKIVGGENLLPNIDYEISNHQLIVDNKNKCNWVRNYDKELSLYISFTRLDSIYINVSADVYSENTITFDTLLIYIEGGVATTDLDLEGNALFFRTNSTGNFHLKGNVKYDYIYSTGYGYVFAQDLISDFTHVVNKSTGDCYVNCNGFLLIEYILTGDVYYSGNPSKIVIQSAESTGKLIKLD